MKQGMKIVIGVICSMLLTAGQSADADATSQPAATQPAFNRISLEFKEAPLQDVLAELSKQANVKIHCDENAFRGRLYKVSIAVKDASFWTTLTDLCTQGGLNYDLTVDPGGETMIMMRPSFGQRPVLAGCPRVVTGTTMIVCRVGSRRQTLDNTLGAHSTATFELWLESFVSPAQKVVALFPPRLIEAVDEKGQTIPGENNRSVNAKVFRGNIVWQVNWGWRFDPRADTGRRLATLKGVWRYTVARTFETITIDDLKGMTKPVSQQFRDFDVTVYPMETAPMNDQVPAFRMKVDIRVAGSDAKTNWLLQEDALQTLFRRLDVCDPAGGRFAFVGASPKTTTEEGVRRFVATFIDYGKGDKKLGPPARLTWPLPQDVAEITEPFEFKDLAIP